MLRIRMCFGASARSHTVCVHEVDVVRLEKNFDPFLVNFYCSASDCLFADCTVRMTIVRRPYLKFRSSFLNANDQLIFFVFILFSLILPHFSNTFATVCSLVCNSAMQMHSKACIVMNSCIFNSVCSFVVA